MDDNFAITFGKTGPKRKMNIWGVPELKKNI